MEGAPAAGVREQISLPGRGTMTVRRAGHEGEAVVLLHGWGATADLNFGPLFSDLSPSWRVLAPDHRGHGGGIVSDRPFSLKDCADDVAELIRHLEIPSATVLGYSMGGPIAMLLARRHPHLVNGLVLCATAPHFAKSRFQHAGLVALGAAGSLWRNVPRALRTFGSRLPDVTPIAQAGGELASFEASGWLHRIDVPTAVVMTTSDHLVPPLDQARLSEGIPGSVTIRVDGDHDVCRRHPRRFNTAVADAISVVQSGAKIAKLTLLPSAPSVALRAA